MRWSQAMITTLKETPADAVAPSHVLMLRAGLVRQLGAGAYTYMPLGFRVLKKAVRIIEEEMDRAGALELLMPTIHPVELWKETGRYGNMGGILMELKLGSGQDYVLGPTHEEVITDLARDLINSYKQLPVTLYQVQTKFRDEPRPRFGIIRTREFLMKDAYSFDANMDQLHESYDAMYEAYCRIFDRAGLPYVVVEAESGPIGGESSHEFMVPCDIGEDTVIQCSKCDYAANRERAEIGDVVKDSAAIGEAPSGESAKPWWETTTEPVPEPKAVATPGRRTIQEVCDFLKVDESASAKLLVFLADDAPVAVLLRGDHEANEAKVRRAFNAQTLEPADAEQIQQATGAPMGFLGPIDLKIPMIVDRSVAEMTTVVVGGNKEDVHLTGVVPGRDFPLDRVGDLRDAEAGDPCPKCGAALTQHQGIEVGHVFKLGTKYSQAMGATYLDDKGQAHPLIMGCYGIGVNRIIAAAIEASHDDNGIIWPLNLAPFEVLLAPLQVKNEAVMALTNDLEAQLTEAGYDVLVDDRDARPGFKFKDADLIGIPLRVVIGERGLKDGTIEVKWRTDAEARQVSAATAAESILAELEATHKTLESTIEERRVARAAERGHQ